MLGGGCTAQGVLLRCIGHWLKKVPPWSTIHVPDFHINQLPHLCTLTAYHLSATLPACL